MTVGYTEYDLMYMATMT